MQKQKSSKFTETKFLFSLFTICLFLEIPLPARAQTQINPDRTLPTNVNNLGGGIHEITGGARPNNGANVFHSFKNFSVQFGDTARFLHPQGIDNIITRITGGSPSQINGTIQTSIHGTNSIGHANLFLINPSGIVFGKNARLDIGGSFFASTADKVKFADGTEFSAINPTANPLLSVSVPIGLQYGSNPNSTIRVEGSGNNLIINFDNTLDRTNRPDGLSYITPQGQTMALVGSNVVLDGGNVTFPEGRVEIWSVNSGEVAIVNSNGRLQLQPGQKINYGNIELINTASVDTSGNSAGSIQLQGDNVSLFDGSVIITETLGNGTPGTINVSAFESLKLKGRVGNENNQIFTGIIADVVAGAIANGNNIFIETKTLQLLNGSQIYTATFGQGDAGNLSLKAKDIQLIGHSPLGYPSGIFSPVLGKATGNGGKLNIETQSLHVIDGAQIFTSTFGFGNAGNLNIVAENIEVKGGTEFGPSLIEASATGNAIGNGGNLNIKTRSLRVTDAGQIGSATFAFGNAGNLQINAENIELVGQNKFGRSGLFGNAVGHNGNGGNITLTTNQLMIRDGAAISVSNFQSQNRVPPGTGAAGNIQIYTPVLRMENQGIITADTNTADFGNITITSQNFVMRHGSRISTNARSSSNGGNIRITTDTLVAAENSDITANAQQGFGGQVVVNARGIFGTQFRSHMTPESDITASSELGAEFNGMVEIITPDVDPSQGLVQLPTQLSDPSQRIATDCSTTAQNRFVVSGRGGLRENPNDLLTVTTTLDDLGVPEPISNNISQMEKAPAEISSSTSPNNQLLEAQGWFKDGNGEVMLVAEVQKYYSCRSVKS